MPVGAPCIGTALRRPTLSAGGSGAPGVVAIAAATFVMVTSEFLPIGLLGSMARDLNASVGRAGLMITAPGLVAAAAAPILTILAGRTDRRQVLLVLTASIGLADVVVGTAPALAPILLGRALLGAALGGFWAFSALAARRLVADDRGDRAVAVVIAGISIGTVVGVPLGTAVGSALGWRPAFLASAALAGLVLAAQHRLLPAMPAVGAIDARVLAATARRRAVRSGWLVTALAAAGQFASYSYIDPFLTKVAGFDRHGVTALLALYGVAGLFGTWLGGRVAALDVAASFSCATLLVAVALAGALAMASHPWVVLLCVAVWGAAFGVIPVCIQLSTLRAAPDAPEAGSALTVTAFQIALAAGASVGGVAADLGGVAFAIAIGAALSASAALILARGRKSSSRASGQATSPTEEE